MTRALLKKYLSCKLCIRFHVTTFRFRTTSSTSCYRKSKQTKLPLIFQFYRKLFNTSSFRISMSYHVLRINCKIRFWILLVSLISPHKNEISHSSFKKWKFFFWCASLFSKHNIIQTSSSFYAGYGPENHKNEGMWVVIFPKT